MTLQCQAQINPQECAGQDDYSQYLKIIKKDKDFFKYLYKLRNAVTCVVDEPTDEILDEAMSDLVGTQKNAFLRARHRVVSWSMGTNKIEHASKSGHGKQLLYLPFKTFCAIDRGISFIIPEQTSSE